MNWHYRSKLIIWSNKWVVSIFTKHVCLGPSYIRRIIIPWKRNLEQKFHLVEKKSHSALQLKKNDRNITKDLSRPQDCAEKRNIKSISYQNEIYSIRCIFLRSFRIWNQKHERQFSWPVLARNTASSLDYFSDPPASVFSLNELPKVCHIYSSIEWKILYLLRYYSKR